VSTFRLEPEHFHLTTGTFNLLSKTDPHSRLSGAPSVRPNPLREFVRPRNLLKLRVRAGAVNPLRSQDFHLISTVRGVSIRKLLPGKPENSFTARPKTLFHLDSPQNPAQAEAEDGSKIKDRWEALLFAETLQGTLSPNANPGKGSVGGLLNWMPKTPARIQRAAQTHQSLVLDSIFYTKLHGVAQEENQKSYRPVHRGDFKPVERRAPSPVQSQVHGAPGPGGDARFSTGKLAPDPRPIMLTSHDLRRPTRRRRLQPRSAPAA
jgi:hypothetical protein